jgi:protein TonB
VLPAFSAVGVPLIVTKTEPPKPRIVEAEPAVQPYIRPASDNLIEPASIPPDIARVVDDPGTASIATAPVASGSIGSLLRALPGKRDDDNGIAPPPPPPPPPPPVTATPIRVGGNVQRANLIQQVTPKYPDLARRARVQGAVIMEATIDRDGSVADLRVISGNPLLNQAAIDAVKEWKYKPTILNGEPIEVITTITVTFTLQ